jgi:hypothetical protein
MSYARTLVKLSSFQIVAGADTIPYSSENVPYATDASVGTTVKAALDLIFAVLYPNTKAAVDFYSDLPLTGNDLNDYRLVLDDGDGKAAGYRWEQREGDSAPAWYKVHDMDWSNDAILAALMDQTLDLYVSKYGRQDLDVNGDPLTGVFAGQNVYGGTSSGSNLTLHANAGDPSDAPADQTGYIQFNDDARPTYDASFDMGTSLERFRNAYFSGDLSDGTNSISIDEIVDAFLHSQTPGNPHNTSYDDLSTQLGTLTLDGDVSGSADLSTSGNKTLTVAVANDSHTHDAATTITGFDSEVYEYLKVALQDNSEITWIFDDGLETIEADVTISSVDYIDPPAANKILVGNSAGDTWVASDGLIELTGDATGSATYDSATDKWSIATTVGSSSLDGIDGINLTNKTFTSVAGNPTVVTATAHGLQTGEKVTLYGALLTTTEIITYIDQDSFSVAVSTAGADSGYYIPEGGQLLWNPDTQEFNVAKEYEEIRLGELSGLNEDVLTQYVAKDGRSGGQEVSGGISASENLILQSTTNATKGSILARDDVTPFDDAAYSGGWTGTDLGSSSRRWNDLYIAGEGKGFRVENVGALPSPSGTQIGRLVYYNSVLYHNTGSAYVKAGASDVAVSTKNSNYTMTDSDDVILGDGTITITLPLASSITKRLIIKNIGTGTVTIDGDGSETIDGSLTYDIFDQYHSLTLVSNGTGWFII